MERGIGLRGGLCRCRWLRAVEEGEGKKDRCPESLGLEKGKGRRGEREVGRAISRLAACNQPCLTSFLHGA